MSRVYISGGITNVSDYKLKFLQAEEYLLSQGYEVINPAKLVLPESCTWVDYMSVCIQMLRLADTIYMLKGHENSKGAKAELRNAILNKKTILYEEPKQYLECGRKWGE